MDHSDNAIAHTGVISSALLGRDVPVSAIVPHPSISPRGSLPLLVNLHGGGGSRDSLLQQLPMYGQRFAEGALPPLVAVSFSAGPASFFAGPWDQFALTELRQWAQSTLNARTDRDGVLLMGISMGGYGALSLGLRHPDHYRAIAALEPAVEPSFERLPNHRRGTWWRNLDAEKERWGSPVDEQVWKEAHPANVIVRNAATIRESGVDIYLEVGDCDYAQFHDGTEFVHRVLWDNDIRHEYHLVRWADHAGKSLPVRIAEAHAFLAAALSGDRIEANDLPLTAEERAYIDWMSDGGILRGEPPPAPAFDAAGERGATVNAYFFRRMKEAAVSDEDMRRAYARLPPTTPG